MQLLHHVKIHNTNNINKKNKTKDLTTGNLFVKILLFCIPLALMGILQLLFNTADLIVVSRYSGDEEALGAIGSTTTLINLLVNLFMGLSVGTNVVTAKYFGEKNYDGIGRVVHTSVLISVIFGFFLAIFGITFCDSLLTLMHNDLELSRTYLKIYFIGMPFNLLYNFAAAILRALGDTKRPMIYLTIGGIINVFLNLIFVIQFDLSVAGVAIATVISQVISCILIMITLYRSHECYQFRFSKLIVSKKEFLEIIRIGLPAGVQSSIFSISNVIIQSSVNLFGSSVMNGNTAATSVEGFVYTSMNSVYHASLAFIGQNYGAKKIKNIKKVIIYCLIIVTMIATVLGGSLFLLHDSVLGLYTNVPFEKDVAFIRLHYLCLPYFLCGIMDVMCGCLRGLGYSTAPLIVTIIGVVGFRISWIYLIFYNNLSDPLVYTDLNLLFVSYPISWIITFIVHVNTYFIVRKKVYRKLDPTLELKKIPA